MYACHISLDDHRLLPLPEGLRVSRHLTGSPEHMQVAIPGNNHPSAVTCSLHAKMPYTTRTSNLGKGRCFLKFTSSLGL